MGNCHQKAFFDVRVLIPLLLAIIIQQFLLLIKGLGMKSSISMSMCKGCLNGLFHLIGFLYIGGMGDTATTAYEMVSLLPA